MAKRRLYMSKKGKILFLSEEKEAFAFNVLCRLCQVNQYLDLNISEPVCQTAERCEPGLVFWPPDKTCYQLYTQERGILAFYQHNSSQELS
jgi:hypothetical protein